MDKTKIGWVNRILKDGTVIAGHTFNPWHGCHKKSRGCQHCYAKTIATHYGHDVWGPASTTPRRLLSDTNWKGPHTWNRHALKSGHQESTFSGSMCDVFEKHPDIEEDRKRLWTTIMETPRLNWLLLTKRPEDIMELVPPEWRDGFPDHVWVGTSVENQRYADERLPLLLQIPAKTRFLSCEPLVGPVDLSRWLPDQQIHWVIAGGESGNEHLPLDIDWVRPLRDQCQQSRVPFFFKQVGGLHHDSGGRILDGRTWDEMPPEFPKPLQPIFHRGDGLQVGSVHANIQSAINSSLACTGKVTTRGICYELRCHKNPPTEEEVAHYIQHAPWLERCRMTNPTMEIPT